MTCPNGALKAGGKLTTRREKERVRELDIWKAAHVAEMDKVREDPQKRQAEREAIDETEQQLEDHDGVDESCQKSFRNDRVLLDKLGEVVEPRCCERGKSAFRSSNFFSARGDDKGEAVAKNKARYLWRA